MYIIKNNSEIFPNTKDVTESFKVYLEVINPKYLEIFIQREKNNKDAAMFEAIIFSIFREYYNYEIKISENPSSGGVDFLCYTKNEKFAVEATTISVESVENHSGLKNDLVDNRVSSFSFITEKLKSVISSKVSQLSDYEIPRILAIGSTHFDSDILLGTRAAEKLLVPDNISIPLANEDNSIQSKSFLSTDLETSIFFKIEDGKIIPCRQGISAILLVDVKYNYLNIVGILHPEPIYCFDYNILSDVHFLTVEDWPIKEGKIKLVWIISDPEVNKKYLKKVVIKDEEIKSS